MLDLFSVAFSPINVVFTVLLIVTIIYWVLVILGALDVDVLSIGADADLDIDADADADVAAGGGGALRALLAFFHVGELPVMVLVSLMVLSLWVIAMLATHYLNPGHSLLLAVPLLLGNLLISALVVKVASKPARMAFAALNRDCNASREVVGRIGTVVTTEVSQSVGQVEVPTGASPILLNAVTEDGQVLHKGDEAVVVSVRKAQGVYVVAPVELEK